MSLITEGSVSRIYMEVYAFCCNGSQYIKSNISETTNINSFLFEANNDELSEGMRSIS